MTQAAIATEQNFYIAAYDKAPETNAIHRATLNTGTGKITLLPNPTLAEKPFWLTFSPDGKFLYAALMTAEGSIGAYRVATDGSLAALNTVPSSGKAPCHLAVDAAGKHVLVANYTSGTTSAVEILPDGSLGERTAFADCSLPESDPDHAKKSNAHGVYLDANEKFVYVCDLGKDSVWIYRYDKEKGTLTPADSVRAKTADGSGPRHLVLHPNGKIAYANGEMGMDITVYTRNADTGALDKIQTVTTLPEGADRKGVSTSELTLHPSTKWLYVVNRAHNTITSYTIAGDGTLTWLENVPALADAPFPAEIDHSGKWLIVAGSKDGIVRSFAINPASGKLTPTEHTVHVTGAYGVTFPPKSSGL